MFPQALRIKSPILEAAASSMECGTIWLDAFSAELTHTALEDRESGAVLNHIH